MDFSSNRGGRPNLDNLPSQAPVAHQPANQKGKKGRGVPFGRLASVLLLFSAAIVVAAVIALFVFDGTKSEKDFIKTDKYQAVFLNDANGQVYFGKLSVVNDGFYRLTDIFYVRVQQVQPSEEGQQAQQNISLAKLGNELHGPEDTMYIAKDKVLFWENLKDDGQVVEAIVEYKKDPDAANQQQQQQQNNETNNNQ